MKMLILDLTPVSAWGMLYHKTFTIVPNLSDLKEGFY